MEIGVRCVRSDCSPFALQPSSIAGDALAADPFDDAVLRGTYGDRPAVQPRYVPGPPIRYPWDGCYFGAHAGYTNAGFDLGNATASLLDHILRDTVVGRHVTAGRSWRAATAAA